MATATAESTVTEPAEQAAAPKPEPTTAAAPGPLARILAPVEPARPVQPLGSTANMGQQAETARSKDSSDGAAKGTAAKNSDRGSAVAALVHALAARLGRGGTAVKRTHTITETRVSGSTTTGLNKAERLHKHDAQHKTNRDAKTADLNNKQSQRHGRTSSDTRRAAATDAKTSDAKAAKSDTASRGSQDARTADTKTASTVSASKPDGRITKAPAAKDGTTAGPSTKGGDAARPGGTAPAKTDPAETSDPKDPNAKPDAAAKPDAPAPVDLTKAAPAAPATEPKLRTRPAREAGYRDGTRAAAVVGQARAYKDGAVDGWDDRTAADKAEQRRMDDTRARNATKPKPKDGPPMKPASGSTIDLAKKAAPAAVAAQVTAVGERTIEFVADGAAHSMSRGEVRTLKAFERRLGDKRAAMGRVAEGSKATRLQAVELATRAQRLAEDAKSVHGGARIVALLSRLAERSRVLRARAEEIEKNAHRGSDAVKALAANAETRHGGIYRAVVDSPLTTPAEREFYMDKEGR